MSNFEKLLADLEAVNGEQTEMAKAMGTPVSDDEEDQPAADPVTDEEEEEPAAPSETTNPEDEPDEDGDPIAKLDEDGNPLEEEEEEKTLTKSMTIDGEEFEVIDADALMKSLSDLGNRVNGGEEMMSKALGSVMAAMKTQGEMIKSLSEQLDKVSKQGRGRKAVLTMHERPSAGQEMAKSEPPTYSGTELMAKCMEAQRSGAITGVDVSRAEVAIQNGGKIPDDVMSRLKLTQ